MAAGQGTMVQMTDGGDANRPGVLTLEPLIWFGWNDEVPGALGFAPGRGQVIGRALAECGRCATPRQSRHFDLAHWGGACPAFCWVMEKQLGAWSTFASSGAPWVGGEIGAVSPLGGEVN